MAITEFQNEVLRLLAVNRRTIQGSYVAGGLALNQTAMAPRESHDIDVFHDADTAMKKSYEKDANLLVAHGIDVHVVKKEDSFVEAVLIRGDSFLKMNWCVDSVYRFFPLEVNDVSGFTMHPLDLATNKLLALVGRTVVRDWIDTITAIKRIQPLPYLLSAACGKDPGYTPLSLLEKIARRRYNQVEIDDEIAPKGAYNASELCCFWHETIDHARKSLSLLPVKEIGKAVLNPDGTLFTGNDKDFVAALNEGSIVFHEGALHGASPTIVLS